MAFEFERSLMGKNLQTEAGSGVWFIFGRSELARVEQCLASRKCQEIK